MAFRSFPDNPDFQSEAEKTVFGLLHDQLPDDAEVYCNVEYFDGAIRREVDFLISIPELGLIALEVKGGQIIIDGQQWLRWNPKQRDYEVMHLVNQIDAERRLIRNRLDGKLTKFPALALFVVTTGTDFAQDVETPGFGRKQLIAKSELDFIYRKALDELKLRVKNFGYSLLSQEIVRKEFGTITDTYEYVVKSSQERSQIVDDLSVSQMFLLELMQDNPRILIKGGPGSGKTILAIEHALLLSEQKLRVGLICYNRGLGRLLNYKIDLSPDRKKPFFVGSLLDTLQEKWLPDLVPPDDSQLSDYYNNVLTNSLLEHANEMQDHQKVDAWVVDEAQDLKTIHWQILRASLRDPENGAIHAFGDNEQNLFEGTQDLPWFYAVGRLHDNLRSSKTLARVLNSISDQSGHPNGVITGTQPELVYVADRDLAEAAADEVVGQLIDSYGWRPGDVAVITTRQRHSKQQAQLGDLDQYWDDFFAGDSVMYTNVSTFKGLERPVVIVAVNGIPKTSDAKQIFYVALSRARDDLVLVGQKEDLVSISDSLRSFNEISS
jgi:hypothetical protein